MEFSIKFDTAQSGWSIVYFEGLQLKFPKIQNIDVVLANNADPDEIMRHFSWVFTVCQSIHLGVSGSQRVKMVDCYASEVRFVQITYGSKIYRQF